MNRGLLNLFKSFILAVMIRFSYEDSYKINRRVDIRANEVWWAARDKFSISQSVCSRITSANKCSKFSASTAHFSNPCSCICHWDKTTFMNKCGKWQCIDDRTIRQREGKTFKNVCGFRQEFTFVVVFELIVNFSKWNLVKTVTSTSTRKKGKKSL